MQLALIPPKGLEARLLDTTAQMALPIVAQNPTYVQTINAAKNRGDFIMMDNGAAEHMPIPTTKRLCTQALLFGADEVVLPDVLYDGLNTMKLTRQFFDELKYLPIEFKGALAFAGVAQGKNINEAKVTITELAEISSVDTICLPRLLISQQYKAIRIDLADWITENFPDRFKIHLLGTSPVWPAEIQAVSRYARYVRSVDTSLPFNYAIAGVPLARKSVPPIHRPSTYFSESWERIMNYTLLQANINTMLEWLDAEAPVG